MFTCGSCCDDKPNAELYVVSPNCTPHCNKCFAYWVQMQIQNGNSLKLMCPCGQHKLRYIDFRQLQAYLNEDVKIIFANSQRQSAAKLYESEITCPECRTMNVVFRKQVSYHCLAQRCPLIGRSICCKHNIAFSHPRNVVTGAVELFETVRCSTCVAEASGDIAVPDVMARVQDALNDRCPSCNGYVGEPEDFGNCMALECRNCPEFFCGFCYTFGCGDRSETHEHVRNCTKNPRNNYFVESEAVWRMLMERRKLEIVESILATSGLAVEAMQLVRDRARAHIAA